MRMWGEDIVVGERSSIGQRVDQYRWELGALVVTARSNIALPVSLFALILSMLVPAYSSLRSPASSTFSSYSPST